jgi:hypothetical protein
VRRSRSQGIGRVGDSEGRTTRSCSKPGCQVSEGGSVGLNGLRVVPAERLFKGLRKIAVLQKQRVPIRVRHQHLYPPLALMTSLPSPKISAAPVPRASVRVQTVPGVPVQLAGRADSNLPVNRDTWGQVHSQGGKCEDESMSQNGHCTMSVLRQVPGHVEINVVVVGFIPKKGGVFRPKRPPVGHNR